MGRIRIRRAPALVGWSLGGLFALVGAIMAGQSLNLTEIVKAQDTAYGMAGWYWLRLFPMFVIFFISALICAGFFSVCSTTQ